MTYISRHVPDKNAKAPLGFRIPGVAAICKLVLGHVCMDSALAPDVLPRTFIQFGYSKTGTILGVPPKTSDHSDLNA